MTDIESDIHGLDADLQAKSASLKLAHTRLENRTNRPGMDLCRDEVYMKSIYGTISSSSGGVLIETVGVFFLIDPFPPVCFFQVQHGLINEVSQLEASITALKQKLSEAQ